MNLPSHFVTFGVAFQFISYHSVFYTFTTHYVKNQAVQNSLNYAIGNFIEGQQPSHLQERGAIDSYLSMPIIIHRFYRYMPYPNLF